MSTNLGDITIELFDEDAPKTVENFKKLAADAVRVAGAVDGTDVRGHTLRLELAKG